MQYLPCSLFKRYTKIMTETKPPLYLIDAYGLIYRSYFAFMNRPLQNSAGKNVSALFGFARLIVSLLNDGAPLAGSGGQLNEVKVLAAVFDSRSPTFRHKMFSGYKANRQKAPEDLHSQVPLVEEFLSALNVPCLQAEGFEADDIIATLAEKCRKEKRQCYIISSDKDLLQLVCDWVYELRTVKTQAEGQSQGAAWKIIGPAEVKEEWKVTPDKILDLLSLAGDASDNIPGVKGIGEKTAADLLARYGSLDEVYSNIAGISGAAGKKLAQGKEEAYFSKSLIKLETNVPLSITEINELSVENLNREAGARVLLREDIRQSAKQLCPDIHQQGTELKDKALSGSGNYKTILDIEELKTILAEAKKQNLLALDFETDSLDAWNSRPVGISFALKEKEAYYVPVAPHGDNAQHIDPKEVRLLLTPFFSDPEMTIIAHNAKYDYKVCRGWGIERWKCKIWDTMVAAWLVDPERNNYSLGSLAAYTFNYTAISYKDIVPKGQSFDTVPLEKAAQYSAEDADLCMRLMLHLKPKLEQTGTMDLFEKIEMPLLPILGEMEGAGIKIDPKILSNFGIELEQKLENIQRDTWKMAGHEFNLSSTKQLQEVLFNERKLIPVKKIKTGYSTDAAALEELALQDPLPALILRHRTLAKIKSTYIDSLAVMADKNSRLHTTFDQTGTATGRLSSREPNLQNIPIRSEEGRRIREAFIADKGCLLISADYSQIELVVLAHLSQDENLIGAFKEGSDVHARTAALIFGIDEDKVNSEQRRMAKTINFGVMYGMSAFRLANELGISRTDASVFIDAYFNTYSGVRRFIEDLIKKTEDSGFVSTILGRRRYIQTINSRNKTEKAAAERVAVNAPIQGSAADIVKTAMLNLDKRLTAEKSPARLLLQVHDELILECPESAVVRTIVIVKEEMENAVKLSIPLKVSIETGKKWG